MKWTLEETMLAFELYCALPSGKDRVDNPQVVALAEAINRSADAVKMKLQNFKALDPFYTKDGKKGLSNYTKLDEEICNKFLGNLDALIAEASDIKQKMGLPQFDEIVDETIIDKELSVFIGGNRTATRTERIGQSFFRQALLAAYDNRCCFTGIAVPELLRASHIKPWSKSNDVNEKTNPRNGLLLNALCDAAFDKGYVTIDFDYVIEVSPKLLSGSEADDAYFAPLNGRKMSLPSRFLPEREFIKEHNEIFNKNQ